MTATDDLAERLRWTSATSIASQVRAGELAPREVIEAAFARIADLQPRLNLFIRLYRDEALAEADRVAARIDAGEHLPLAGVPVATKDEFAIAGEVITKG